MLKCKQITERSDEYISGDLGIYERIQFRVHLLMCQYCRRYVRQTKILIVVLQRLYGAISKEKARQIINAAQITKTGPGERGSDELKD